MVAPFIMYESNSATKNAAEYADSPLENFLSAWKSPICVFSGLRIIKSISGMNVAMSLICASGQPFVSGSFPLARFSKYLRCMLGMKVSRCPSGVTITSLYRSIQSSASNPPFSHIDTAKCSARYIGRVFSPASIPQCGWASRSRQRWRRLGPI